MQSKKLFARESFMIKPRIIEQEGVTGELIVESYDKLMRRLMQKGYLDTSTIISTGIVKG